MAQCRRGTTQGHLPLQGARRVGTSAATAQGGSSGAGNRMSNSCSRSTRLDMSAHISSICTSLTHTISENTGSLARYTRTLCSGRLSNAPRICRGMPTVQLPSLPLQHRVAVTPWWPHRQDFPVHACQVPAQVPSGESGASCFPNGPLLYQPFDLLSSALSPLLGTAPPASNVTK